MCASDIELKALLFLFREYTMQMPVNTRPDLSRLWRFIRRTAPCSARKSSISGKRTMYRLRNIATTSSHIHRSFCLIIIEVFGDEHVFPMLVGHMALMNCDIKRALENEPLQILKRSSSLSPSSINSFCVLPSKLTWNTVIFVEITMSAKSIRTMGFPLTSYYSKIREIWFPTLSFFFGHLSHWIRNEVRTNRW